MYWTRLRASKELRAGQGIMQLARLHARSADFRGLRLRFVSFRFRGSRRSCLRLLSLPGLASLVLSIRGDRVRDLLLFGTCFAGTCDLRRSCLRLIWPPRIGVPRSLPSKALFKVPVSLIRASGCCGDSRLRLSLRRRALAASN